MNHAGSRKPTAECRTQGIHDQVGAHVRGHRPADDATREQVNDHGQVHPALPSAHVGYVRGPDFVRGVDGEFAIHDVVGDGMVVLGVRRALERFRWRARDAIFLHQPGYSPPADLEASLLEVVEHAQAPVGSSALLVNLLYLLHQSLVLLCPRARLAGSPRVISACRNTQLPTHQSDREVVLLRLDCLVWLYELSLAKKDAAFFRKSRSMVT
jgi:hypothetical protein